MCLVIANVGRSLIFLLSLDTTGRTQSTAVEPVWLSETCSSSNCLWATGSTCQSSRFYLLQQQHQLWQHDTRRYWWAVTTTTTVVVMWWERPWSCEERWTLRRRWCTSQKLISTELCSWSSTMQCGPNHITSVSLTHYLLYHWSLFTAALHHQALTNN